jgi:hypothetical protein
MRLPGFNAEVAIDKTKESYLGHVDKVIHEASTVEVIPQRCEQACMKDCRFDCTIHCRKPGPKPPKPEEPSNVFGTLCSYCSCLDSWYSWSGHLPKYWCGGGANLNPDTCCKYFSQWLSFCTPSIIS